MADMFAVDKFVADKYVADMFVANTFMVDKSVADMFVANTFVADKSVADMFAADKFVAGFLWPVFWHKNRTSRAEPSLLLVYGKVYLSDNLPQRIHITAQ